MAAGVGRGGVNYVVEPVGEHVDKQLDGEDGDECVVKSLPGCSQ
jgi:hypothetical protein